MWGRAEIFTKIKNAYEDTGIGGERLGFSMAFRIARGFTASLRYAALSGLLAVHL